MDRIDVPRDPELGQMLDKIHYKQYDKKFTILERWHP